MRFAKMLSNLLNPVQAPKKLYEEIGEQRMQIKSLITEYKAMRSWHDQYASTLSDLTGAMGALVWKKDKDNKYCLANPLHCESFFGFPSTSDCLEAIKGRTDADLIASLFRLKGVENTFGEICLLSDEYTKKHKKVCHFLEAGVVDGGEVLLYAVKTPQIEKDEFVGTIGIAWDFTEHSAFMITMLNRWRQSNRVKKLHHSDKVFCYSIEPQVRKCGIFNHICPVDHDDGDFLPCGACDVCKEPE